SSCAEFHRHASNGKRHLSVGGWIDRGNGGGQRRAPARANGGNRTGSSSGRAVCNGRLSLFGGRDVFMIPVLLSNTITFAYMTVNEIGLTINTVPVVALGIGLGVDYSFYIADGIREEILEHGDIRLAIRDSLHSAGRGVLVT